MLLLTFFDISQPCYAITELPDNQTSILQAPEIFRFPQIQLHRGHWLNGLQENTLKAFEDAKLYNIKMIELDVQFSKDHKVVVVHDYDLKRLIGLDIKINQLTAKELQKKAHIPTLYQVLMDPKIPFFINVEIKQEEEEDLNLEQATMKVIHFTNASQRVLISSFNDQTLHRCALIDKNIPRAFLVGRDDDESEENFMNRVQESLDLAQTNIVHLDFDGLNKKLSNLLKARGLIFNVWTVDDTSHAREALSLGASSIITNRVDILDEH